VLLDVLRAHKWIYIKLAIDDALRAATKHGKKSITVEGIVMHLERGGSLNAKYSTRDLEKALAIAGRLESAGLKPNVVRSGPNYVVYIATTDLLRLAERDGEIGGAIALYLTEKCEERYAETEGNRGKDPKRYPSFSDTVAGGWHLRLTMNKNIRSTKAYRY
jgi:hypothetical protein